MSSDELTGDKIWAVANPRNGASQGLIDELKMSFIE